MYFQLCIVSAPLTCIVQGSNCIMATLYALGSDNFFFIEVQSVYNIVLVSNVEQSDSVTYISFFRLFFIVDYCVYAHVQSWLTLCDPINSSPPGFSVHGIFRARILEWVAISSSRGSSWPRDWTHVSCVSALAGGLYHWCHLGSPVDDYNTLNIIPCAI